MFQLSNPFTGLPKVFLVLILIGAVAAFAFTNSDLTNFMTNSAKAETIRQQNIFQQIKDSIDIENYRKVEEAKTQAQLNKIDADKVADEKLQAQKLQDQAQKDAIESEKSRIFNYGQVAVSIILAICFSIILIILSIQFVRNRLILTKTQAKQINAWQNLALRKKEIKLARQRERMTRALYTRQTQRTIVPAFYTDQDAPISWEDLRQQFADKKKANPFSTAEGGDPEIINVK